MRQGSLVRYGVAWILLPNLPFLLLSFNYSPARTPLILTYAMIGLTWPLIGPSVAVLLFAVLFLLDLASVMARIFNLGMFDLLASVGDVVYLNLGAHLPYLGFGLLALACGAGAVVLTMRGSRRAARVSVGPALLAAVVVMSADVAVNRDLTYGLKPLGVFSEYLSVLRPGVGSRTPASAVGLSGVESAAAQDRTILLVMVEALGKFKDEGLNRKLSGLLTDPAVTVRYEVALGSVPFFGSTTAGELRELCGRDDSYVRYTESLPEGVSCLPERLRRQGYTSVALHGFTSRFFNRREWYPVVGFDRLVFLEDVDDGRYCGEVFEGHCDDRMLKLVRKELAAGGRRLVYWLTLDSHFPVKVGPENHCGMEPGQACAMMDKWDETLRGIRDLALDPALPPMDILIVGDHAPPLISRKERNLFDRDEVPWIALRAR